jgi:hypothetical protein
MRSLDASTRKRRGRRACQGANGGLAGDVSIKALRPIS